MNRLILISALCVWATSAAAQQAPIAATSKVAAINEHETIVRLSAVAADVARRYDEERNRSLNCTADLASEIEKLNQQITATQTAEATIKRIDAEQDDAQDAEEEKAN